MDWIDILIDELSHQMLDPEYERIFHIPCYIPRLENLVKFAISPPGVDELGHD